MPVRLRSFVLAAALLAAAAPTTGCAPYAIVQQSGPPSAFKGVSQVSVHFDWSAARPLGKTEAEYLSEKSDADKADFQEIKRETDAAILQGLNDNGGGAKFVAGTPESNPSEPHVVVVYGFVQTGIYTYVFNLPSKVEARFVWSRDGKTTDVIDTRSQVAAGMTTPSDHQRMEMVGRNLGRAAAHYYKKAQEA